MSIRLWKKSAVHIENLINWGCMAVRQTSGQNTVFSYTSLQTTYRCLFRTLNLQEISYHVFNMSEYISAYFPTLWLFRKGLLWFLWAHIDSCKRVCTILILVHIWLFKILQVSSGLLHYNLYRRASSQMSILNYSFLWSWSMTALDFLTNGWFSDYLHKYFLNVIRLFILNTCPKQSLFPQGPELCSDVSMLQGSSTTYNLEGIKLCAKIIAKFTNIHY